MGFGDREEALEADVAESECIIEHNWEFETAEALSSASYEEWDAEDRDYSEFYEEDDDDPPAWLVFDMDAFDQLGPWWFGWYTCLITGIEEISRQEALEQTWEVIEYEYVYSLFPGWRL